MIKIVIGQNDVNKRLDNFLLSYINKIPKSLVCKLIRKKKVKVNGKKSLSNYRLNESDVISVYVKDEMLDSKSKSDDFFGVNSYLNIVYEDQNILIINKPSGLICHPDDKNKIDCLVNRIKKYLFEKGEYDFFSENVFSPSLVNRIDRNTQGLVIAAKNSESLKILNEKIKNREIKKYYKCLVHGKPKKSEDTMTAFLTKDSENNKVSISKSKNRDSRMIKTKYKILEFKNNTSLLEVELLTGRCHQIRAHLAYMGNPIIGDKKYGFKSKNCKYQALISYKIRFEFSTTAKNLDYLNLKEFEIKNSSEILERFRGR